MGLDMGLDYADAKNQIYIPVFLVLVGCGITKWQWLPYAVILSGGLVWLKLYQHRSFHS
jgi:hypothetical protein